MGVFNGNWGTSPNANTFTSDIDSATRLATSAPFAKYLTEEIFQKSAFENITDMYLVWENKEINTNEISVIFKKGKPFLLKAIFIFKNDQEWFNFLNFMNAYSKETGLFFTESQS